MKEINGVKIYTSSELAELIGVSKPTILKYIKQGNIVKTKIGRSFYISEENIIAFLNGRTEPREK